MHVGERHKLGEAAGLPLQIARGQQMAGPGIGCSTAPNMIVTLDRNPTRWPPVCLEPLLGVTLSGQRMARTSSSRISAAVPGRVLRPLLLEGPEVVARRTERRAPSVTSRAVKAWMWMVLDAAPAARRTST